MKSLSSTLYAAHLGDALMHPDAVVRRRFRSKTAFSVAKGLVAAEGCESAVLAAYHATLGPPFCLSAVKSFFDAH